MDGDRCTGVITGRPDRGPGGGVRQRRLRGQHGLAPPVLGGRGGQLPHPRLAGQRRPVLAALYAHGAARAGEERGFHAVAVDARRPAFDGGIATRLDSIPFGIVVNTAGQRFYDEGEELWPKRYAIWGRNIAGQPGQIAYSIWDAKVRRLFLPPMYGPARRLARGARGHARPRRARPGRHGPRVQRAIRPGGTFDPGRLDDCATTDLYPAKSHWAQPIDTPPYYGIAMRPGITFTYLGVAVTDRRACCCTDGTPFAQRVRGRRNHVRQHPVHRLPRGLRPHHRQRLGPHRRSGGRAPAHVMTCSPRPSGSSTSATHAATARATARCSPRWSAAPCWRPGTSPSSPTCAMTAGPASTPACTRRRTSSASTRRRFSRAVRQASYRAYLPAWRRPAGLAGLDGPPGRRRPRGRHRPRWHGRADRGPGRAGAAPRGPYSVIPYPALLVTVALPTRLERGGHAPGAHRVLARHARAAA